MFSLIIPEYYPEISLTICRILYAFSIFISVFYVHFVLSVAKSKGNKYVLAFFYLSTAVIFFSIPTPFFISGLRISYLPQGTRFIIEQSYFFYYFILVYYLSGAYGIFEILSSRKKAKGNEKLRLGYILVASFVAFSASLIYFPTILNIKVPPIDNMILATYTLIMAYAIFKQRLFDFTLNIGRVISYIATAALLAVFYLGFIFYRKTYFSTNIDMGFISLTIAYGIFVGFAFERLRMFIQTSSDKVFLKGKYDFKDTMSYFVNKLFKVVSLDELKEVFEKARLEIIESKILSVALLDAAGKCGELPDETLSLLKNSGKIVFSHDIKNRPKDIEFYVPCFSKESLIAVLLVGKKLSEDPFKDDEIDVFRILAPQIATVIERVRPYETAQKDLVAEQEKVKIAQKAAEENARLAALGTLAAGLAHEIRNPMTVIRSKSETVIEKIDDKDYVLKFAKLIPEQIDRILGIVNRMLKFARTAQEELIPCDTNKILQDTAALLDGKIKDKNLKLSYSLGAKSRIMANPVTLSEAVFNIILNAIDFTPCGGEISLSSADSDGKVVIEIKDNGEGIAADKIGQIFDPFFTTRAEGTGLGLSIAYRTIREHKGSITTASTPGAGALFTITLPACQ